jgi:ABC-type multidrug transport system, permease component
MTDVGASPGGRVARILLLTKNEFRLLALDPFPVILLIAIPSLLAAFLSNGIVGGAAISVPGLAALFGFFGLSTVGFAFYRDHGWGTWTRLRTTPASLLDLTLAKSVPLAALFVAQYLVLLSFGLLVLNMPWRGSVLAGLLVVIAIVGVEIALGLLFAAYCSTINQLNALCNVGGLLIAGLGGALTPVTRLPAWVRDIAPASPVYWALRGLRGVIANGDGLGDVVEPVLVLVLIAVAAGSLAIFRLREDDVKHFYASR